MPRDGLSATETIALGAGQHVTRPVEFQHDGGRYVGGVAYQIVHAPVDEVEAALRDPDALRDMLPRTKNVTLVDEQEARRRLSFRQGNDFVEAEYTVVVEDRPAQGEMRFWLDPTAPHDIDDVWGFFRVSRLDESRTLITVGVALDVGPGVVRLLFEKRIQDLILSTPERMKHALEQRSSGTQLASRLP
jgi:hypothetical protein